MNRHRILGAMCLMYGVCIAVPTQAAPSGTTQSASAPLGQQQCGLPDFTGLVRQAGPSVVNVRTFARTTQANDKAADEQTRELLRRFFGIPQPAPNDGSAQPDQGQEETEPSAMGSGDEQPRSVGSGFVLSADGYVMTNAHVVDGADRVVVTLSDRREFKARVVGLDARSDVAVLKIDAKGLPTLRIGDSSQLKVGEWVVAIGSPFGLDNSVTAGIVSAKARDTGDYTPLIQTDVAVNPGNSGGPLLDLQGRVVGINSQIYSETGGFMGISFAIPINQAMAVADQLKATGYVVRGKIGVEGEQVSSDLAASIGLPKAQGAFVRRIEPGAAAAAAGVKPGDIILALNGTPVERATDLPRLVGSVPPGTRVDLEVWRLGRALRLPLVVGEWAKGSAEDGLHQAPSAAQASPLGLRVMDLNAQQRRELGVDSGVMIEALTAQAARAGLRVGDVIVTMNNTELSSAAQFDQLSARLAAGTRAALLVRRGAAASFVLLRARKR